MQKEKTGRKRGENGHEASMMQGCKNYQGL